MNNANSHIAQQLAHVASVLQQQRTGLAPKAVTAVLSEDTLVVTLHDALTPAVIRSSARMTTDSVRRLNMMLQDDSEPLGIT